MFNAKQECEATSDVNHGCLQELRCDLRDGDAAVRTRMSNTPYAEAIGVASYCLRFLANVREADVISSVRS